MPIAPEELHTFTRSHVIIDVRTPVEFSKGHIPGAVNLPLFTNEERAKVGTVYKREGRKSAVSLGLKLVGPKLHTFPDQVGALAPNKPVLLYCWRGGMRSSSMAWLLLTCGFSVEVLKGGYKAFRAEAHRMVAENGRLIVIGGPTGSGKTEVLHALNQAGECTIDLEGLAQHKGSAFGGWPGNQQPTTEHFLNLLWEAWCRIPNDATVWIEDESKTIGSVWLPEKLYLRIRTSQVVVPNKPIDERAAYLASNYGELDIATLRDAFLKISDRLGGQNVNEAVQLLEDGNLSAAAEIALSYYDKAYEYGLSRRSTPQITRFDARGMKPYELAEYLIQRKDEFHGPH